MKVKLDENFGARGAKQLRAAGHDVSTVVEQGLSGSVDRSLIAAVQLEQRCLVTLDLDFGNPPRQYNGIAVVRLSKPATLDDLASGIDTLIRGVAQGGIEGKLWIIHRGRIREYQPPT